jgi:hypothetical protein
MKTNMKFINHIKSITSEIDKISSEKTKEASEYLKEKIKSKISGTTRSGPGQPPARATGDLIKGVGYKKTSPTTALVGFHHPAEHAHLMELGTKIRSTKGRKSKIKKPKRGKKSKENLERIKQPRNTGKVDKRPFLLPTFEEEKENIKKLMSTGWLE